LTGTLSSDQGRDRLKKEMHLIMEKRRCFLFGFLIGVLALTFFPNISHSAAPGRYRDWNDIDEVEVFESFRLSDYSKIVVLPLDTESAKLPPRDDNTYKPVKEVLAKADEIFRKGLKDKVADKIKIVFEDRVPPKEDQATEEKVLILKGRITEINPGSRALRIWVGFGAGKSRVEVEGELADAKSQKILLKFKQGRIAAMDARNYEKTLQSDLERIGKDIGNLLKEL